MKNTNNNSAKFIKTQHLKTAEGLKSAGFELLDYQDGTWTFINNPACPLTFECGEVTYSNMLHV